MRELCRIFLNKKVLIVIALITVLNFSLFLYYCGDTVRMTKTDKELQTYINTEYNSFLKQTVSQADLLNSISIFKESNSFTSKNISKTVEDYSKLSDISLEYGENRGVIVFKDFNLSDLLLLAFLIMIVLRFNTERKKGLVNIIRSTKNGRLPLCVSRLSAVILGAVVMGALLYVGDVLAATVAYGDMGMSRAIQSVPEFMRCSMTLSIGQYIFYSVIIKISVAITVALLFYFLISLFNTYISTIISGLIIVISVLLNKLILPISDLNWLRYLNLYTMMNTEEYFVNYYNLNMFGNVVGALGVSFIFCIVVLAGGIVACLVANTKKYVSASKTIFSDLAEKLSAKISRKKPPMPLFIWEGHKLLNVQKGIIFIAIVIYIAVSSSYAYSYIGKQNDYEQEWYSAYNGVISESMISDMNTQLKSLEKSNVSKQSEADEINKKLANGEYKQYETDTYSRKYNEYHEEINKTNAKIEALKKIQKVAQDGYNYSRQNNVKIQLVNPESYNLMFKDDTKTTQRNAILVLIGIVCSVAGIFAYERQNNIMPCLRSKYRGRGTLFGIKTAWVFIITAILSLSIFIIQLIQIKNVFGLNDLSAPIQSLELFRGLNLNISILQFIILLFAMRIFMAFIMGLIVMLISYWCSDTISVIGISVLLLGLPSILSSTGMMPYIKLDFIRLIGVIELLC